jgi:hypothetical protein
MFMISQIISLLLAGFAFYGIYTVVMRLIPDRKKVEK